MREEMLVSAEGRLWGAEREREGLEEALLGWGTNGSRGVLGWGTKEGKDAGTQPRSRKTQKEGRMRLEIVQRVKVES